MQARYLHRIRTEELVAWLTSRKRRPLVLRGARQVGKTWLVRDAAHQAKRELLELNFERDPRHAQAFAASDPRQVLGELSLLLGREIPIERSILFLDEIQAAGEVLGKLRGSPRSCRSSR